jgi:hypothetical protein
MPLTSEMKDHFVKDAGFLGLFFAEQVNGNIREWLKEQSTPGRSFFVSNEALFFLNVRVPQIE